MKIVFIPKGKSEDLMNYSLDEIKSKELEEIKHELNEIDSGFLLKEKNFGTNADWIMILALINGLTTIFLLGDKIESGIEGWIKIGKRIKNIFSKSDYYYVDVIGAKVLGLNYISEQIEIQSLKIVMESELPIKDLSLSLTDRKSNDFISKPYAVYFITYEINEHKLITLGIRSDGQITEQYSFDKNDLLPF